MVDRLGVVSAVLVVVAARAVADDTLYRYEGKVLPDDPSAGWAVFNACEDPCAESVQNGQLTLEWTAGDLVNYTLLISNDEGEPPLPPTFWVEWRFRSNQSFGGVFPGCDAGFVIRYRNMFDLVNMYGDTAISFSGDIAVYGLNVDEFNTYRFESLDGLYYRISVDGEVFIDTFGGKGAGGAFLQLLGAGGCGPEPITIDEWDFVRYGTIASGEKIVASDPPSGFLDPDQYAALDRFTVTFDSANYVYIDEITVEVTGGIQPNVIQTRRREGDEPDTVEIVLDGPLPIGEATRITLDDGATVNVIEYTLVPGDANSDGVVDLLDVCEFQNCFGNGTLTGSCKALDFNVDDTIDLDDLSTLVGEITGP